MDYLQYLEVKNLNTGISQLVLNLIINGLPSIRRWSQKCQSTQ